MAEDMNTARPQALAEQTAAAIPKNFQEAFTKVVAAGMKVMFSDETHEIMLDALSGDGDPAQNIGEGMATLMALLYEKSNGTMPPEVIIPAAVYLLAKGADFIEQVTGDELTPEVLSDATDIMVEKIMGQAGVPPEKYRAGIDKVGASAAQQLMNEPDEEDEPDEEAPGMPEEDGEEDEAEPEEDDEEDE